MLEKWYETLKLHEIKKTLHLLKILSQKPFYDLHRQGVQETRKTDDFVYSLTMYLSHTYEKLL